MWYAVQGALRGERPRDVVRRSSIVALVSFLTHTDLFGAQALLPRLVDDFETDAATMGFAVNAATFGMAIAGLVVAWFADRIDRKRGLWISLACLTVPTFLLGVVDNVGLFIALRVVQGAFMAAAFTLTITYLSEQCDVPAAGGAMAAYITGNVAANLFGRILAVSTADAFGLTGFFWIFAALNLMGAALAFALFGARNDAVLHLRMIGNDLITPGFRAVREHAGPHKGPVKTTLLYQPLLDRLVAIGAPEHGIERNSLERVDARFTVAGPKARHSDQAPDPGLVERRDQGAGCLREQSDRAGQHRLVEWNAQCLNDDISPGDGGFNIALVQRVAVMLCEVFRRKCHA